MSEKVLQQFAVTLIKITEIPLNSSLSPETEAAAESYNRSTTSEGAQGGIATNSAESPVSASETTVETRAGTGTASDLSALQAASSESESVIDESILNNLRQLIFSVSCTLSSPSDCSRCWLEMILVETALRNRDRFSLLWPHISSHFAKMLGRSHSLSARDTVRFDYVTERRVVGIFKIATRMLARKKVSASLLELLGCLFTAPGSRKFPAVESPTTISNSISAVSVAPHGPQPLPHQLLTEFAGQVGSSS